MTAPRHLRHRVVRPRRLGVSYARFSTKMQASIPQQEQANRRTAAEFEVTIPREAYFADEGITRSSGKRKDLLAMFEFLEAHPEYGFIVLPELERMTSGVLQRAKVIEMCQRLDITILTEDMGEIDPWDEEKMQEADERSVRSKAEVLRARRRTRRHMKALIGGEEGNPGKFVMRPCYGMRVIPMGPRGIQPLEDLERELGELAVGRVIRAENWELHPVEYPWLLRIFTLADEGKTDNQIARWLVGNGVLTKTGRRNWTPQTVKQILLNDFYKGDWEWGANEVKHYGDDLKFLAPRAVGDRDRFSRPSPLGAMVDVDLWERVNTRRMIKVESGGRYLQPGRRVAPEQTFDDKIFCARCGYKMYGQFDLPRRSHNGGVPPFRYSCKKSAAHTRAPKGGGFGPPCTTSQSITDRQLLAEIAKFGKQGSLTTVFRSADGGGVTRVAVRAAEQALQKAEGRFERTKEQNKEGFATLDEVREEQAKVEEAKAILRALETSVTSKCAVVPQEFPVDVDWEGLAEGLGDSTLAVSVRRAALDEARLQRIYVDSPRLEVEFLD